MRVLVEFDLENEVDRDLFSHVRAVKHSQHGDVKLTSVDHDSNVLSIVTKPEPVEAPSTQLGAGLVPDEETTENLRKEIVKQFGVLHEKDPEKFTSLSTELMQTFGGKPIPQLQFDQLNSVLIRLQKELAHYESLP